MTRRILIFLSAIFLFSVIGRAEQPSTENWAPWDTHWLGGGLGEMSAAKVLDPPAGGAGPVMVRDGHFYVGSKRLRLWGVSFAFSACLPSHEKADAVADRLASLGVNGVRLHHMDMMKFPAGIFDDDRGEHLSDAALERLDYLVFALKKRGIYCDLNLHVSRTWTKTHKLPGSDQLSESFDKLIDLFDPELIAADKQYARDLLTHVNAYTHARYADEPAICFVEINNENTLFLWGGEGALGKLPEPYAGMLQKLWNNWLAAHYGSADKLRTTWARGDEPLGDNLLRDSSFANLGKNWIVEQHETARIQAATEGEAVRLTVTSTDGTDWHLQFNQPALKVKKGRFYTLSFSAHADHAATISSAVSEAHDPWQSLGLAASAKIDPTDKTFTFGFSATQSDDNARLSFSLGHEVATIELSHLTLREGGRLGLREGEDPIKGTVASHAPGQIATEQRSRDWFDFLQQTDQHYWTEMRDFLKNEIQVKCPITGTIGLGPLGTLSQSKMDFVDAHAYWDHPTFPNRQWDMSDWRIKNTAMVDRPESAAIWGLAATRVEDKPFTVTEYNHAAPNEWQAECVPMIAAFAALQDWDGIFLFAYSHSDDYDKGKMASFFDVEGNPLKMPLMPLAARLFLGGAVPPARDAIAMHPSRDQMLATGSTYYYQQWPFVRDTQHVTWQNMLDHRIGFVFDGAVTAQAESLHDERLKWQAGSGSSHGRMVMYDPHAAIWVGSPAELPRSNLRIESPAPFISLMLVPSDPEQTLESADRVLLAVVARAQNAEMRWNAQRTSVSNQWGQGPPRVEVVSGTLSFPIDGPREVYALKPDGSAGEKLAATVSQGRLSVPLGSSKTLWYLITKPK